MTKGPLAVVRQSDTLYSVPRKSRVNVRSSTVAACNDVTSNSNKSRLLNFIHITVEIFKLRSTKNKESHFLSFLHLPKPYPFTLPLNKNAKGL